MWYHGTSNIALASILSNGDVVPVYTDSNVSLGGTYLTKSRLKSEFHAINACSSKGKPVVLIIRALPNELLPDEDWVVKLSERDEDEKIDTRIQVFLDDLFTDYHAGTSLSDHYKLRYAQLNTTHHITWEDSLEWCGSVRLSKPLDADRIVQEIHI